MLYKLRKTISLLHYYIEQEGKKKGFQKYFRHILGISFWEEKIEVLNERVDTLTFLLNETVDITSLQPTKNQDLRIMQQCDALLLALFDKFCRKHNLEYWLSYGTLLGAVRHKGFIPWDDDMDVVMPRNHFNKLINLLNNDFSSDEFIISDFEKPGYIVGFGYEHQKTGIWLDIFPVDIYSSAYQLDDIRDSLKMKIKAYRDFYNEERETHNVEYFNVHRKEFFNVEGKYDICYHNLEVNYMLMCDKNDIFPLKKIEFEGQYYPVPCNYDKYLRIFYGNYMSFPKSGILHHDLGRGALYTWAKKNDVDMNDIKNKLQIILDLYYDN